MIIERTHYYSKPGHAESVLAARQAACAVRRAIGLPVGTIRVKDGGDGPDVSWECAFATRQAQAADLAARAASAAFEAARATMRSHIDRFERLVEQSETALPDHWSGDHDLAGQAI